MYFVIAYDIWPHLTGRAFDSFGLMRAQLWTWFVGMIVLTFPWHSVGISACRAERRFTTTPTRRSPHRLHR
jgi:heme/copper-type cytochrome/quinol oxidase subunit 1